MNGASGPDPTSAQFSPTEAFFRELSLREFLDGQGPGRVKERLKVERLLTAEWESFEGSESGGMLSGKLSGRTEDLNWSPPFLTFTIERHGAAANGSSRAELQRWKVDLSLQTARIETSGRRQLRPTSRRLNVMPLAEKVANQISKGLESDLLKWTSGDRVAVQIGKIIPETFAQTTLARRQRFRSALSELLKSDGWREERPNVYARSAK